MYDPAREPPPMQVATPEGTEVAEFDGPAFFGCIPDANVYGLIAEYTRLRAHWEMNGVISTKPIGEFWSAKSTREAYPELSAPGRWYASMPTSNVACERVFGIFRSFEGGARWGLIEHSVEEELMAKTNAFLTESMMDTEAQRLTAAARYSRLLPEPSKGSNSSSSNHSGSNSSAAGLN